MKVFEISQHLLPNATQSKQIMTLKLLQNCDHFWVLANFTQCINAHVKENILVFNMLTY